MFAIHLAFTTVHASPNVVPGAGCGTAQVLGYYGTVFHNEQWANDTNFFQAEIVSLPNVGASKPPSCSLIQDEKNYMEDFGAELPGTKQLL